MKNSELRETIRAAFARYDEDASGSIDARELRHLVEDLGGALTDSDLSAALRTLDKDRNGAIDLHEFVDWWTAQAADLDGDGAVTDLKKTLERLKDLGRERFHVDIHTASWRGFGDVVERLVDNDKELANERDATEYGNMNTPLHYAAYQGHANICTTLLEHGASVNATNASGCTPVFFAAQQSHEPVVSLLLQHQLSPVDVCHAESIIQLFQSLSGSAPASPSPPTLSEPGECSLRISWQPPKSRLNEVAPISLYKLRLTSPIAPTRCVLAPGSATETVVDGLAPNASYCCEIAAVNLHGISEFGAKSEPLMTLKARPSPPQSLMVSDVGCNAVRLQWTLVQEDDPTHCVVQQSLGAKDGWKLVYKGEAHRTSCSIENLFGDRKYLFRVTAVNSTGYSEFSTPVTARTLASIGMRAEKKNAVVKTKVVVDAVRQFVSLAGNPKLVPRNSGNQDVDSASDAKEFKPAIEASSKPANLPLAAAQKLLNQVRRQTKSEKKAHNATQDDEPSDDEFVYYHSDASSNDDEVGHE